MCMCMRLHGKLCWYVSNTYSLINFGSHNHTPRATCRLHQMYPTNSSSISIIQMSINCPTSLDLSKGWHQYLRVDIDIQDHSPRVEINEKKLSKPTIQQSPPFALMESPTLMETLRHGKNHAQNLSLTITPHQCFSVSPFDINGKWYLLLGLPPLPSCLCYFSSSLTKG